MFDDVYDNGTYLLGKKTNVLEYLRQHQEDGSAEDIIDELSQPHILNSDIVLVHYDVPMGVDIEVFKYSDIVNHP